ncbi:MAG: hypothetical protein NTW20_02460 [Rhodobacterales bacterium]|nr:hypothetical protein [Rhodobacterales bacterium]
MISYIPEPDLTARRRIILATFPLFVVLVIVLVWFFNERTSGIAIAAAVYCIVSLFVFALRLCRTSYVISARRVVRFVGGKKVEDLVFAESTRPVLLDFAASDFLIWRWMGRFFSLGSVVEARRLKPAPWTVVTFFTSRDPSRMRIGYPGHSLPIQRLLKDVTLAWEAAQDTPKATP